MLRLALITTTAALIALPSNAHSRQACAERADIAKRLGTKYFEHPVATGVANNGGLLEVLSSNGQACMFAVGQHWEMLPEKKREKPAT